MFYNMVNLKVENKKFISDIVEIIIRGRDEAYKAVNESMVRTYWTIGKRIVEEEQHGELRAEYGTQLIKNLSEALTDYFGKGFTERNLRSFRQFYILFPNYEIWHARVPNLKWTHFRSLITVDNPEARNWYMNEAASENWTSRTLDRNIDFTESRLESAILTHIQKFLLELGKGYAFVARQQQLSTDAGDFYIDLVFYNYLLRAFLLIDLKTTKISHQDVGQMDMYVRMYDELKRTEGDNPTIGLILCTETSKDIAKYSVLHENPQLFAAKYLTYLPSEEELKREIERQKEIFQIQQGEV